MTDLARAAVLEHFRWEGGHADVWRVFADANALRLVVEGLVAPWRHAGVTKVAGIEARGFLLGGACAVALSCGFVAARKDEGMLPGPKSSRLTDEDYRGLRHTLRMQCTLTPHDRVLLVDDWAERGSQATTTAALVRSCGAEFLGLSVIVDQLTPDRYGELARVTALVRAEELGDPDAG